jgi:hypothetical protein
VYGVSGRRPDQSGGARRFTRLAQTSGIEPPPENPMSVPFRRSAVAAVLALAAAAAQAQSAGQLMFTSLNSAEDGWSMVALTDLAPNTTVWFTDNEWSGSGFNTGESYHRWNTGAGTIAAGTVVRFTAIDNATTLSASIGTLARQAVSGSTNYGISQSADTVYAYLGSSATAPTTFLSAISSGGLSATNGLLTNTGLAVGASAIEFAGSVGFAQYAGARNTLTEFSQYAPLVANAANWTNTTATGFGALTPDTTAFTVQPIPEPSELAFMLAGLGLAGAVARRRARRAA